MFFYDPGTGVFTRRIASGKAKAGEVAGCARPDGYVRICVNGRKQYAHRLAWLYVTGQWPDRLIDHVDGNPSNNAITNLRLVTHSGNQQNRRRGQKNNKTGLLGVCQFNGKYRATISKGGAYLSLGLYQTKEEAFAAYLRAKRNLHAYGTI